MFVIKARTDICLFPLTEHCTQTIIYLILIGYVMDSYLSVLETLTNPILTDYFGMTSDTQVYFFLGIFCVAPAALLIM